MWVTTGGRSETPGHGGVARIGENPWALKGLGFGAEVRAHPAKPGRLRNSCTWESATSAARQL